MPCGAASRKSERRQGACKVCGGVTTKVFGEECGGIFTTLALGEEGGGGIK